MCKNQMKKQRGITLIALVITILIIVILAGVTINMTVGKNGIITRAVSAREDMKISEGKEKISLALLEMQTDRAIEGRNCDLDYISKNIDGKIKGAKIEGIKGDPVVKIYISYKDYMFKITPDLQVLLMGNINIAEEPEIEIIRDVTQTGVEKVNLTVKAKVEEGEISEIVKPDGTVEYSDEVSYLVTENGAYTFKAVTAKGTTEEKTVNIQSITMKDAIEIGETSGGSGEETVTCSHIYETKYDDTNHWKQCILCNNKINIVAHSIVVTGTETCKSSEPAQIKYCTDGCGYKITLTKIKHSNLTWINSAGSYEHRNQCGVCTANTESQRCYDADGNKLGCDTGKTGTCVVCGHTYTDANHKTIRYGKCGICGKRFYDINATYEIVDEMTTKYMWHIDNIIEGLTLTDKTGLNSIMKVPDIGISLVDSSFSQNSDGSIDISRTLQTTKSSSTGKSHIGLQINYTYNGNKAGTVEYCDTHKLVADNYPPTVKSITATGADSSTEFSRNVTITAKFEETWDSIVEMALYDSDGSVISKWSTATRDGTIFTKEFNVVAETTSSKQLTVKAKDRCGNIGEGKVTIGKIDTKSPVLTSTTKYNEEWTIGKQITIEATDEGSGNVQIALGSETDYKLANKDGNKYFRTYNFTGDVYEDIVRIVYIKDAVGNVSTNRITIGKMDRTSPTITNINKNNMTITIEANDINTKLNKEGSGISGYAISKSREVPTDNSFQTSNTFTVEKTGKYYIWVKDKAGNLSETKQIDM